MRFVAGDLSQHEKTSIVIFTLDGLHLFAGLH